MAKICMLCNKKIGMFKSYAADILTGNPDNVICDDCFNAVDLLIKKSEMKIPFKPDDMKMFTDEGKEIVLDYLESTEDLIDEINFDDPAKADDPMDHEIGEAIIDRTFTVDEEETDRIFNEIKTMEEEKISEFLDPLVSEHDAADSFMREIKALNDDELDSVIADQREYYNNAEWAYILYVKDFRNFVLEQTGNAKKSEKDVILTPPEEIDNDEIVRMREVFKNHSKEELSEILSDDGYTYEARKAAEDLLKLLS